MSILSLEFLLFVTALVAVFYVLPRKARWVALLAGSMGFYLISGWQGLCYLLAVTTLTWLGALAAEKLRMQEKAALEEDNPAEAHRAKRRRKTVVALTLTLCLGAMIFIKYFDALRESLNALFAALSSGVSVPTLTLLVPLGLSYFTFQSAGYLIDVSRGKAKAERNPLRYLLFVSFFPQMAQGPISPYGQLAPQLREPKRFEPDFFVSGFQLAMWGYFKKLVLADRLAPVTEAIAAGADQPGWLIFAGAVLYLIRLYADFSGGMDVIRGTARMLGIDMVENFKRPFFSTSVAEYWRRWHISLGAWFRTYLFYPLCTSRFGLGCVRMGQKVLGKKAGRALPGALATVVIFLFIGMWHGASWNAVIYGAYFGLLMGVALLLEPAFKAIKKKLHISGKAWWYTLLCMIRTWALVLLPQYFAFTAGPAQGWSLLTGTFHNWTFKKAGELVTELLSPLEWAIAGIALLIVLVVDILCERGVDVNGRLAKGFFLIRWIVLIFLIVSVVVFGCYGEGFDAAAFVYAQF